MKRVVLVIVLVTAAIGAGGWFLMRALTPAPASTAPLDPAQAARAEAFLDLLDADRFDDALAMTTPKMQEGLAGKLAELWQSLPKQLGARASRSPVRGEIAGGQPFVTSTLAFAMLALDARMVFEGETIAGFWLVPAQAPAKDSVVETSTAWQERELAVGEGATALPATLTLPRGAGPFAGVVLVHGSGPQDRDETLGPNAPFRDLAHGLAERGIAVLRYEKRTKAHPEAYVGKAFTLDDETVDDALAAVTTLRAQAGIDARRVFVAGHSLGALAAPRIGQRDGNLAGLVLLAAPTLPLEDTVVRQMRHIATLDVTPAGDIDASLAEIERQRDAVKSLDASTPADTPLMLGLPAAYWRDLAGYDPVAVARTLAQPMLVLQGGRDYQVTPADDYVRWREAFADDARVTLVDYPLLGHTFMPAGDPPGPHDYHAKANVDAKVIADIAGWITAH
ncbi:alpha/beta fold hydrolase [Dokdonella sp. MW10]|uniref:alpha/beta hydrolase n=1 Tax=Dokdonella sp. MW10 TaxID=2992926 RepID=UPI003F7E17D7